MSCYPSAGIYNFIHEFKSLPTIEYNAHLKNFQSLPPHSDVALEKDGILNAPNIKRSDLPLQKENILRFKTGREKIINPYEFL